MKVMSERLGHASTTITADTYSHVIASMGANAAERVAAMIFGAFDHERRFALITPNQVVVRASGETRTPTPFGTGT